MTIRRSRVRTEPLPDILEPLDPDNCAQLLAEAIDELKQTMEAMAERAKRQQLRDAQEANTGHQGKDES